MDKLKKCFADIRCWILFFFLIRLIGITQPPLEVAHNWRQTTVTMVARNFLEVANNPFYPRVDMAGDLTGITGMEFPVFNYLIYLTSELFGYQHWYGRLINLFMSSLGVWFFYRLIRKLFNRQLAYYAGIVLLCSIWLSLSRKIMPGTFAMSLGIAGCYYGYSWLKESRAYGYLVAYWFFSCLGILSKIPTAFLFALFVFPMLDQHISLRKKGLFTLASAAVLLPVFAWYQLWVPHLVREYGFYHFFMGQSLATGWSELMEHIPRTAFRFYDTALKYIGFVALLIGVYYIVAHKHKRLAMFSLAGSLAFLPIVIASGDNFAEHTYYVAPFVPIMALVAAYGIANVPKSWMKYVLVAGVVVEGIAAQQHDISIKDTHAALLQLETDLDSFITHEELIAINADEPTTMYFSHRKGWLVKNEELQQASFVKDLKTRGLKAIVILKKAFGTPVNLPYEQVFDNEHYAIYLLSGS